MTLDITIGNAEIVFWELDADECTEWQLTVHQTEHSDAPYFPHDNLTKNTNYRSIAYGAIPGFEEKTGFVFPEIGVHRITDLTIVDLRIKLEVYKLKIGDKKPGWVKGSHFNELGQYIHITQEEYEAQLKAQNLDINLARLLWLEWWMDWALKNCKYPSMQIS